MTPLEYITFKKTDFESNCIKDNQFTENQSSEFFEIICTYIERFKKDRSIATKTEEITDELISKLETQIWKDNNWELNKHTLILSWITKAVFEDPSYYWAKIYLGMYANRHVGQKAGMIKYEMPKESNSELFQLLKAEENQVNPPQRFIIKSDDEMKKIYTICQDNAFECEYSTFRNVIETANFQKLIIKRQNITQELVYRLSDKMDGDWYTKVCESKKWEKSDCSKHYDKVKDDVLIKKLDRILPRTIKRNRTK